MDPLSTHHEISRSTTLVQTPGTKEATFHPIASASWPRRTLDSIYIFGGQGALIGSHNAAGSKYPVLDVVDRYKETITIGVTGLEPMSCNPFVGGVMGISIDGAIWRQEFWQSIFTHQLLTLICSFLCQFHANSHMR